MCKVGTPARPAVQSEAFARGAAEVVQERSATCLELLELHRAGC